MADTPLTHASLPLYGRQVFDYSVETDGNGNKMTQTLPGFYEVYTQVDGVDVVIYRRKASGLISDIVRAQMAADAAAPPPAPPAPADVVPEPAPVAPDSPPPAA